jgi:hypothetical protein
MNLESTKSGITLIDMFPIEFIGSLKWSLACAERLKQLRGGLPRKIILEKMAEDGISMSPEMMRRFESAEAKYISIEFLEAFCNVYQVHFSAIIPCVQVGVTAALAPSFQ